MASKPIKSSLHHKGIKQENHIAKRTGSVYEPVPGTFVKQTRVREQTKLRIYCYMTKSCVLLGGRGVGWGGGGGVSSVCIARE